MNDDEIAALKAAAEAATPGPWMHAASIPKRGFEAQVFDADGKALLFFDDDRTSGPEADANAAFIAAAREGVPALLARLERAEAALGVLHRAAGSLSRDATDLATISSIPSDHRIWETLNCHDSAMDCARAALEPGA